MYKINKLGIILPINICNARCEGCAATFIDKNRDFIPFKNRLLNIIKDSPNLKNITISANGEPLLKVDMIEDVLKILKPFKFEKISLYTNGILLTKDVVFKLKLLGLTNINISIRSDKDLDNENSFCHTYPGIAKITNSCEDLPFRFNFLLNKKYINSVSDFLLAINNLQSYNPSSINCWGYRDINNQNEIDWNLTTSKNVLEEISKLNLNNVLVYYPLKDDLPYNENNSLSLFPNLKLTNQWC